MFEPIPPLKFWRRSREYCTLAGSLLLFPFGFLGWAYMTFIDKVFLKK